MDLIIRPLDAIAEYHACEALQRRAWAMPDDLEVVPLHMLLAVQKNGGLLLGAFDGHRLAGFVCGFPGLAGGGVLKHCSHMMGILPEYQGRGVGYRLKLAQRAFALDQGLDLVTWTYDPLQSRNANLNIRKLGTVCQTYIRDYYGPLADGLNAGLPSDRFQVEWWIASERVRDRLAGGGAAAPPDSVPLANATGRGAAGGGAATGRLLTPGRLVLDAGPPAVRVEIPADYGAVKAADPDLALDWRLAARQIFEAYFSAGYAVTGFYSRRQEGERRSYYILSRSDHLPESSDQARAGK